MNANLLRVASVCSGIGGAELAFEGLAEHVFMSEIEAFPCAVLKQRFPHIPLYGDFTRIETDEPVDILVGGTPCQSFSVAGLRGGMADERGNLALEFLRLAERLRARWILWENVPGVLSSNGGRDFGSFLGGLAELRYGWAYRVLDAQHFGLAQRRKRVFVVGCLGDWRRAAAVLFEPASLRGNPPPRREAGKRIAGTLAPGAHPNGFNGQDANTPDNLIATTLGARDHARGVDSDCTDTLIANPLGAKGRGGGWRNDLDNDTFVAFDARQSDVIEYGDKSGPVDTNGHTVAVAFGGNRQSGPLDVATAVNAHGGPHGRLDFESETFVTHSLRADGFDASEDGTGRGTPLVYSIMPQNSGKDYKAREVDVAQPVMAGGPVGGNQGGDYICAPAQRASGVRRLTPLEAERLQGFPDSWTAIEYRGKPAADGPRYKALGNAFAVPVVRWIARRIAREHAGLMIPPHPGGAGQSGCVDRDTTEPHVDNQNILEMSR